MNATTRTISQKVAQKKKQFIFAQNVKTKAAQTKVKLKDNILQTTIESFKPKSVIFIKQKSHFLFYLFYKFFYYLFYFFRIFCIHKLGA